MKGKTLTLLAIASMLLSIIMISPAVAAFPTIGVEPTNPVPSTTFPYSFTVDIWVRGAVKLMGVEFKLSYDTTVLTATNIAYGGIFGATYLPWISVINDCDGWLGYAISEFWLDPPFTGDGKVATITFIVSSAGSSNLDLYETKLGDPKGGHIQHTVIDGSVSAPTGAPQAELWAKVINVKKKHMDVCETQDISGLISNKGSQGAYVRALFTVLDADGTPVASMYSGAQLIGAGEDKWVTAQYHPGAGSYSVTGYIEFSPDGTNWMDYSYYLCDLGGRSAFRVLGPSWFKVG